MSSWVATVRGGRRAPILATAGAGAAAAAPTTAAARTMTPKLAAAPSLDKILARPGGLYTSAHAQAVLDNMKTSSGYNTVRVFIDPGQFITPSHGISTSVASTVPIRVALHRQRHRLHPAGRSRLLGSEPADHDVLAYESDNEVCFDASQAPFSTQAPCS
ncbi:MAG TPA: hypothetical protein VK586_08625 [Streptosporangiaceae bacterium]|nr:hypothetical protein [Streptosporangiaceae bacterium]